MRSRTGKGAEAERHDVEVKVKDVFKQVKANDKVKVTCTERAERESPKK